MARMGKRAQMVKAELEYERKRAQEEEYVNSLSPDERVAYMKEQEAKQMRAMKTIAALGSFASNIYYNK